MQIRRNFGFGPAGRTKGQRDLYKGPFSSLFEAMKTMGLRKWGTYLPAIKEPLGRALLGQEHGGFKDANGMTFRPFGCEEGTIVAVNFMASEKNQEMFIRMSKLLKKNEVCKQLKASSKFLNIVFSIEEYSSTQNQPMSLSRLNSDISDQDLWQLISEALK